MKTNAILLKAITTSIAIPDASIVDDDTPGATPMYQLDQLIHGASQLPAGSSGLLVTYVGVANVMGAPFRAHYVQEKKS